MHIIRIISTKRIDLRYQNMSRELNNRVFVCASALRISRSFKYSSLPAATAVSTKFA